MKHATGRLGASIGILYCLLSLAGSAQTQAGGGKSELARQLIGEWRNQYIRVVMHTYNNKDTTVSFEADTSNWEARLHIKPIRTHFLADGSYYSEYRNLRDSIVMRPAGSWKIEGDSLIMVQAGPHAAVYSFHVSIEGRVARFKGVIDFDGDGQRDDEYVGVQRKYE